MKRLGEREFMPDEEDKSLADETQDATDEAVETNEALADDYDHGDVDEEDELGSPAAKEGDEGDKGGDQKEEVAEEQDSEDSAEEEPPADKTPTGQPLDAEMMAIARVLGVPDDLARSYGSPAELKRAVATLAQQRGDAGQKQTTGADAVAKPQAEALKFEFPELSNNDDFEHDPRLVKYVDTLKSAYEHNQTVMQQQHEMLQGIFSHLERQSMDAAIERFDQSIESLGDEYADLLGKGRTSGLSMDSPTYAKRQELWDEVNFRREVFHKRGLPPPSDGALFAHAVKVVFADKHAELARKALDAKVSKRKSQAVSRPTHRKSAQLSGVERAAARVEAFKKKHGIGEEADDDFEF